MIKVRHNCGFFSCCSVKLHYIIKYFNEEKRLPDYVDSSTQFLIYKPLHMLNNDITYDFFKKPSDESIEYISKIDYDWDSVLRPYNNLKLDTLTPFIEKYFSPSDEILQISTHLKEKYNLDFENICAVYYRGTDKYREVTIDTIESFITKMKTLKDVTFLIQSDDQEFIDAIKSTFNNIIIIEENYISSTKNGIHNEFNGDMNYNMIKYFFATLLLIAKCKYLICSHSSNCSLWSILYKGNHDNIL